MADFKIKPAAGTGNKLILESEDGTDVLTTSDSGVTINSPTLVTPALGTPASGVVTNLSGVLPVGVTGGSGLTALGTVTSGNLSNSAIVYPDGHILQVQGNSTARVTGSGENSTVSSQTITLFDYANNDVLIHVAGCTAKTSAGGTGAHFGLYVCGGSLGETTSGVLYPQQISYNEGVGDEEQYGIQHWDKTPDEAVCTYSIYLLSGNSADVSHMQWSIAVYEIKRIP